MASIVTNFDESETINRFIDIIDALTYLSNDMIPTLEKMTSAKHIDLRDNHQVNRFIRDVDEFLDIFHAQNSRRIMALDDVCGVCTRPRKYCKGKSILEGDKIQEIINALDVLYEKLKPAVNDAKIKSLEGHKVDQFVGDVFTMMIAFDTHKRRNPTEKI